MNDERERVIAAVSRFLLSRHVFFAPTAGFREEEKYPFFVLAVLLHEYLHETAKIDMHGVLAVSHEWLGLVFDQSAE